MLKDPKRSFVVDLGVESKANMFPMEQKMIVVEQKMLLMEQKMFLIFVTKRTKNVTKGTKMFANENRVQSDIIIAR